MLRKLLVAATMGLAILAIPADVSNALPRPGLPDQTTALSPARWRGGHHFGGHHRFGGFHGFRRGIVIGAPVYYYGYRGCSWLRHRALVTGSPYWWHRYRQCRRGW